MRQGISTKYLGPTNVRGSRIKAVARKADPARGWKEMSATVPYQYDGTEEEHCRAAKTLAQKLGWSGFWVGGGNVDENGYHFVNACETYPNIRSCFPLSSFGLENKDWFIIDREPGK